MAKDNTAIVKRDTRTNWQKSKYIPKANVIIVMDNEDNTISLMVGDGETNVNDLPDLLKNAPASSNAIVNEDVLIL